MGVDTSERIGRVEEGIALLRAFWSGPVTHHGRYYRFDDVDLLPRPARRIPIVLAVNPVNPDPKVTERAMRRVARLADGWQTDGTPPDVFAERWRQIREYAAEYGRAAEVTHASLHLMVNVTMMRPPRAGSPSRSLIATTAWARSPRRSSPRGWPSVRPRP